MAVLTSEQLAAMSDAELMAALARRESEPMKEIYRRYERTLRAVIQSVLHEDTDVDDVLHEAFLQLWNHADRFVAAKGLHGYLVTVARRRALDRLRRRLAYRRATDRFEIQQKAEFREDVLEEPTNSDLSELLRKMIRQLPVAQQEIVQLTFFEGLSQREIAARKSIALGTVKTRLQLAQKKLLNQLVPLQDKI
ncbi:MAG: sigma-70 family RNA polymerase sigma factor [Verrucomicrobia bacterium]|nr:sigma-70 family RNA polymerase sigma factor [Verrucomicrobiota bacterium]